ncbi:MarR family winged helix-turn-helix transcriptional regulator [Glaciimonas immobilis]|uniref:DNA-binding MarR family transcriptional regulator n=1 Tax=Glaciimonas immobilis TaxID=728004 RepID=A0A840RMD9_9BURK|nr:MarR family transcriptional regulator [Glaciimonas immobilis]KAF3999420.1 MarR family transcriptional regulator [Glaciimonas immobilis]MBB5198923.1 DNA-binding MarR family transcriptional regulator [Glaciimonas immobilis]
MFDNCLYFNTTALARALEREWAKAFGPFFLTPSQAFMLRVVLKKPSLLQSELAKEMAISRSTATRALDGLQKMGLVERRRTESDGREYAIHPTAQAQAMKESLNAASAVVTKRLKDELGQRQFEETVLQVKSIRTTLM